jgi:antirestriction protein ArdC
MPDETAVLDQTVEQPKPKRDFRQEVTDSIVEMLEKGTAPWQKPWDAEKSFELPFNPESAKAYRGGNALHLMAVGVQKGYSDPRWLTYRQAQENGWQVRKGEKGTHIEFWQFNDDRGKQAPGEQSAEESTTRDRRAPIHRVYTVFNAQQVDGIPAHQRKQAQEWEVVQAGEQILANSGAEIAHDQRDRAFYSRVTDSIHLPPQHAFANPADYYGTALHELGHWSGHPSRLNRQTLNESYRFGDPNYAKEELRAELTSVFLAAERGIPHNPEQHAAYVKAWVAALKEDKNEIFRAAKDANRAADFVLALEKEKNVEKALESVSQTARAPGSAASPGSEEPQLRRETSEHVAAFEPGSGTVDLIEKETATEHRAVTANGRPKAGDRMAGAGLEAEKILDGEVNGPRSPGDLDVAKSIAKDSLGSHARLYAAHTDSGRYTGEVIGITSDHVVQKLNAQSAVAHPKGLLPGQPEIGQNLVISYSNGHASLKPFEPKAKGKELAR